MNPPAVSPFKVLVADDTPFMLRLLEATFRKGGFQVLACRSGEEALVAAAEHRPDLILMDVMMPGLDGLSAIRRLKQDAGTAVIPVIVVTSKGKALTEVKARQAGAALFLTKPFSPTLLLAAAREILSGRPDAAVSLASGETPCPI